MRLGWRSSCAGRAGSSPPAARSRCDAILLLLLGGLLDGLFNASTGAYRAQTAELIVYSADSRDSSLRSRIDPEPRTRSGTPGVRGVSGMGTVLIAGRVVGGPQGTWP